MGTEGEWFNEIYVFRLYIVFSLQFILYILSFSLRMISSIETVEKKKIFWRGVPDKKKITHCVFVFGGCFEPLERRLI